MAGWISFYCSTRLLIWVKKCPISRIRPCNWWTKIVKTRSSYMFNLASRKKIYTLPREVQEHYSMWVNWSLIWVIVICLTKNWFWTNDPENSRNKRVISYRKWPWQEGYFSRNNPHFGQMRVICWEITLLNVVPKNSPEILGYLPTI